MRTFLPNYSIIEPTVPPVGQSTGYSNTPRFGDERRGVIGPYWVSYVEWETFAYYLQPTLSFHKVGDDGDLKLFALIGAIGEPQGSSKRNQPDGEGQAAKDSA
jgi:hypothetical protein